MFTCPRPGRLFSSVSGVFGALGCGRFVLPVWQIDVQDPMVFFLTRTNRDVPRS